jgi:hypothetical protein
MATDLGMVAMAAYRLRVAEDVVDIVGPCHEIAHRMSTCTSHDYYFGLFF